MGEIDYIVSDGYDYAQTAMCFLWQYEGKKADDVCYTEDNGREISIKLACYRETGKRLDNYRRKMERIALSSSDDYKALPADPVNRFETEEPDYSKFQEFLQGEVRYASLQKALPEKAAELYAKTEADAKNRRETYVRFQKGFEA